MVKKAKIAGPSVNQADRKSLVGFIKLALVKHLQNTDDMLPAQVISYNPATNRAKVQPLIYVITTDNRRILRAPVASVPVLQLGGGGFLLYFPIKAGDLGWIKANDRDISNFKTALKNASPQTYRKHTFEDAMFIPDSMMKGVSLADSGGVCLQSLNGAQSIVITDDEIKITSSDKITLTAPEVFFDSVNCNMGGVRFDTHVHGGVDPGGSDTDGPDNP